MFIPMKRTLLIAILLGSSMLAANVSLAQLTATLTPQTNGSTTVSANPTVGSTTTITSTVSYRVTNNTQSTQIFRIEVAVQNSQTGATLMTATSSEKEIAPGATADFPVTLSGSVTETTSGRKDRNSRSAVKQGVTVIYPEQWAFVYDVASSESGGGNYYER